jgi:hypothetical protein
MQNYMAEQLRKTINHNNQIVGENQMTMIPCCNNCSDWWHLNDCSAFITYCHICWTRCAHTKEMPLKELLKENMFYYQLIVDKMWDEFFNTIKSISYYWVTTKTTGKKTRWGKLDWLRNRITKNTLPVDIMAHIRWQSYIPRMVFNNIVDNYRKKF